jgi:hypothetical protein
LLKTLVNWQPKNGPNLVITSQTLMGYDLTIIVLQILLFIGLYGIDTNVIHLFVLFEH